TAARCSSGRGPTDHTCQVSRATRGGGPYPEVVTPTLVIPTTGLTSLRFPADPKKDVSPKLKMPPSEATSQYPLPSGVHAIPTTGCFSCRLPVDPKNWASPKLKMPPSEATNQYPLPSGVAAIPTMGWFSCRLPVDPKNLATPKL